MIYVNAAVDRLVTLGWDVLRVLNERLGSR
jgi:hypothetical protein